MYYKKKKSSVPLCVSVFIGYFVNRTKYFSKNKEICQNVAKSYAKIWLVQE